MEVVLPARRLAAGEILRLARSAQDQGWSGVWVSEVLALDAFVLLGALARETTGIRLGTAIVPVSTRSAALLAMSASTLAQLAPGRVGVGLGVSTPAIVADRHDRRIERPAEYTSGVLEVMRAALRGETVDHPGIPHVSGLRIEPADESPRIYLAALGRRMTAVASQLADGVILNMVPISSLSDIVRETRALTTKPYEIFLTQRVCADPTAADVVAVRREIASYCRVPTYARSLALRGRDVSDLCAVETLDEAAKLLPADLLHELAIIGSAAECRLRLAEIREQGVIPLVVPAGSGAPTDKLLACVDPSYD